MVFNTNFVVRSLRPAVIAAVALLAGCAAMAPDNRPPEEVVKARAQARWDALLKEDYATAYSYLGPGSRAVNSMEAYKAAVPKNFYKAAQVHSVVCETPESCMVDVRVDYLFRGSRIKTPLAETWIKQEGNWWFVLK